MGELFEVAVNAHPERSVAFVVPVGIDDPERVSGGNVYDQRIRDGLHAAGWEVRMAEVGDEPSAAGRTLAALPDDALVLIDGLPVARHPDAVLAESRRLRTVVLAHMVADEVGDREGAAYRAARAVIATSHWSRGELIARDLADPPLIVVARPGTDPAPVSCASPSGGRLVCVATVAPHKGQDVLVQALSRSAELDWTCTLVGSLRTDPPFVAQLRRDIDAAGLAGRITFAGVRTGDALTETYAHADLLVAPSRAESYGMAVAEALARGIPVVATGVGGIAEALGSADAGLIVPPDDPWALGVVLRRWCTSEAWRRERRQAALAARSARTPWSSTVAIVASTLDGVAHAALPSAGAAGSVAVP